MSRDLKTLLADNETPETIQSALDALADIDDKRYSAECAAMRAELMEELRTLDGQGRLF